MPEDTPVNTGVRWTDPASAYFRVREMQAKLHQWAKDDPSRRLTITRNGATYRGASSVAVSRYRYRGSKIPTPVGPATGNPLTDNTWRAR